MRWLVPALLALSPTLSAAAPPEASYSDSSTSVTIEGKVVPVGYSRFPANFDPSKPTIVYIMGGPAPISDRHHLPPGLPEGYQVLCVDSIGTTREGQTMPTFTPEQIMRNFTSDRQSELIKDVIKKEALEKYSLFGESHGVQMAVRTVDKIQNDPSLTHKPIAAILDSGMGRQITAKDVIENQKKGHPGPHGRCEKSSGHPPAGGPPPSGGPQNLAELPYVKNYLRSCHLDQLSPAQKEDLVENIVGLLPPPIAQQMGTTAAVKQLSDRIGCPPADKIDPAVWEQAMGCGVFESGVESNRSCAQRCDQEPLPKRQKAQCLSSCAHAPDLTCHDTPLDAAKERMGDTQILGLQSLDDCQNWVASMDYLMANLKKIPGPMGEVAGSAYVREPDAGGHVTFRDTAAYAKCREPAAASQIYQQIFNGNVVAAQKSIAGCYQGQVGAKTGSSTQVVQ